MTYIVTNNKILVPVMTVTGNHKNTSGSKSDKHRNNLKSRSCSTFNTKSNNDFWDYKKNRHGKNWINPFQNQNQSIRTPSASSESSQSSSDSNGLNTQMQHMQLVIQWCNLFIERNKRVPPYKANKKIYMVDLEKLLNTIFGISISQSQRVVDRVYTIKIVMECLKVVGRRDENPFFVLIENRKFANMVQLSETVDKYSSQYLEDTLDKFEVSKDKEYGNVIKIICPTDMVVNTSDRIKNELLNVNKIDVIIENLNIER